jgi:hypothetical protein
MRKALMPGVVPEVLSTIKVGSCDSLSAPVG